MMKVRVKFFANVRDIVGSDEKVVTLPVDARASALLDELVAEFPAIGEWKPHLRIAVNWEYVPPDHSLQDNDEVAIIPPVSGG
ncbi:MAG TPA: molybdopterin converting factor subunit 1 [Bacteroidota bacterium]|jgi:molybdopterin converting factor subunit 1|nr:molybdopterin converting factor subunit 1 [Bacteroidota bacterium]